MDFNSWWTWAKSYEPTLGGIDIDPTIPAILTDSYNEAVDKISGLIDYLSENNYTLLVYRFALHRLITTSKNSSISQLKALYSSYDIGSYSGVVQSASSGPTSASKFIPRGLQDGDARSILLWATPYGQEVEATFEELKDIAIVA